MNDMEDRDLNETEDGGLDAFKKGLLAFEVVKHRWESLHVDRLLGRGDATSQDAADKIAMDFAKGLERYLSSCPSGYGSARAGEALRGVFYAWMSADMNWDLSRIGPMYIFED
jgi:hypothetical protein